VEKGSSWIGSDGGGRHACFVVTAGGIEREGGKHLS